MPHIIFECSDELTSKILFNNVFTELHILLAELLPTQASNCKSRLVPYQHYLVGNEVNNFFIHLTIKILPGRTTQVKDITAKKLLKYIEKIIHDLDFLDVSISVEVQELSACYLKNKV